jgi:GntR family transcriptional regulator
MFVSQGATAQLRERMRSEFLEQVWPPVADQIRLLDLDPEELLNRARA